MEFIHSILRTNQLQAADGDVVIDLPVNPLSVILIHLSPLNDTGTIAEYSFLDAILAGLTSIRVSHKGSSVVDLNGVDLAALTMLWHKQSIWQSNAAETNNDRRSIVLPVMFGRQAYLPDECFPETKKGELQLTLDFDIAATGFDGMRFSVETIEIPEATPTFVQKVTTLAQTLAATGQNDIELPIGNAIRGILCFGTTSFAGAAPTPTLGQLELLVDNRQRAYTSTDFEVSRAIAGLTGVKYPPNGNHFHGVNAAGAGQEDVQEPQTIGSLEDNYTFLTLDPNWDDNFILETQGAGRINLRLNAEAANAIRVMPVERVAAAQFTG